MEKEKIWDTTKTNWWPQTTKRCKTDRLHFQLTRRYQCICQMAIGWSRNHTCTGDAQRNHLVDILHHSYRHALLQDTPWPGFHTAILQIPWDRHNVQSFQRMPCQYWAYPNWTFSKSQYPSPRYGRLHCSGMSVHMLFLGRPNLWIHKLAHWSLPSSRSPSDCSDNKDVCHC